MTDTSREQFEATFSDELHTKVMWECWQESREALAAEQEQGKEPVAWTWDTAGTGGVMAGCVEAHFGFNKPHPDKCILNLTPLYAHPAPTIEAYHGIGANP